MASDKELDNPERRDFLGAATVAVGAVGVAGACYPFISSMNPSKDVKAQATSTVDLASIPVGKTHTVEWQGKPVFVVHRTDEMISAMQQSNTDLDPEPDSERVKQPQWLVVLGICTHLGCVPNRTEKGWNCPCHGSVYDNSGRVLRGPAPRNLIVPHYAFVDERTIIIGKA
ncbi:ubiquinol-cytochrome c reductase iron-sulfur subunit [Candidatus Tenderia electrophaga]|jgi:ubiquinol-cytochrome c reductase iron-sulfur subunit|uniref:Ubiquinol-cytochrome c reductase iron-sulfur subunit n=1 Tax=Candidatus Tenderia electrophaga TaxID=1748243 RepID=A0A0S2TGU4_9GAMM|nr:ubiquinol-cytochrome c reductase iron-sulfur subunit [Candidatus Tenderia electrophaga]